jgi:hypothetical protein
LLTATLSCWPILSQSGSLVEIVLYFYRRQSRSQIRSRTGFTRPYVAYVDNVRLQLNLAGLRLNLAFIAWQRRDALIELARANDLYKDSLKSGAIPQKKRGSLLHKTDKQKKPKNFFESSRIVFIKYRSTNFSTILLLARTVYKIMGMLMQVSE